MGMLDSILNMPMPWQYFVAGAKDFAGDAADAVNGNLHGPSFSNRALVQASPGSFDEGGFNLPAPGLPAGMLGILPDGSFAQPPQASAQPQTPATTAAMSPLGAGNMASFGSLAPDSPAAPKSDRSGNFADRFAALGTPTPSVDLSARAPDTGGTPLNITPPGAFDNVAAPPAVAGSAPAPGAAPTSAPAPNAPASPGIMDQLSSASHNLAAHPGLPGLFDAIANFGTGKRVDPAGQALQAQNQTTQALIKKGLDPDMAAAIAMNPSLLQQVVPQLFGPKQMQHVSIKDAFGNEIPLSYDPSSGRYYDARGKGFGQPGAQGTPDGTPGIPGGGDFYAKGVTQINHELSGDAYLKQFSPEVQDAVKNYIAGRTMPTGRPGFTQTVKQVATKYGADMNTPADDAAFSARKKMRDELAEAKPGTSGGQITFAGTSLGHLADTAEKAAKLDNSSGFGIAPLAQVLNGARGFTTAQASKVNEVDGAVQHYGQEITKFYTGSPGGEAERMRFLNTIKATKSPEEIAGAIRTERDLIPDRLNQLKQQITGNLGADEAEKQIARANVPALTERINRALAKLDPNGPEAKMYAGQGAPGAAGAPQAASSTAAPAPQITDGTKIVNPKTGQRMIYQRGQWMPFQ
jgi:hypothetical protein